MRGVKGAKEIIGILSGSFGVGKSTVTALMAIELARQGYRVGILDADPNPPGIPAILGLKDYMAAEISLEPAVTAGGIKVASTHFWLQEEENFYGFRPLVGRLVKLFWLPINWGSLDYLFIDLPSLSDQLPYRLLEALPLTGVVTVYSPREKGGALAKKVLKMAEKAGHFRLGIIENCNFAQKRHPFLASGGNGLRLAEITGTSFLGTLPLDPGLAEACVKGTLEEYPVPALKELVEALSLQAFLGQVKKLAQLS